MNAPPGFPVSNLASNAKGMGKIKLFPTPEHTSKQSSDPVVLVPRTGIFLGPSKSGKTVALISLILEQYRASSRAHASLQSRPSSLGGCVGLFVFGLFLLGPRTIYNSSPNYLYNPCLNYS